MAENQVCSFYLKESAETEEEERDHINIPSSLAHDLEINLNRDETRQGEEWEELRDTLYDLAVGRCQRTSVGVSKGPYFWLKREMAGGIHENRAVRIVSEAVANITAEFNRVTKELSR